MSASLVGSEMCIRDRGGDAQRRPVERPLPKGVGHAYGGLMAAAGGGPVSYTHLTLPTICSV
eukprot:11388017-Alexandrium_andersonii.AAC.1